MIKPHGSDTLNPLYVADDAARAALTEEAQSLPSVVISSAGAANAVMLGGGYFNPLKGYMNKADAVSVAQTMHTSDGLFWPTPVLCMLQNADGIEAGSRIALRDPHVDGNPVLAVMDVEAVEELSDEEMQAIAAKVYGTTDMEHPGVAEFYDQGRFILSGPIQVLNYSYFEIDFPNTFKTAYQIRDDIAREGWNKVVAFQTRNPMHRAHEELCHMAMDRLGADGLVIHMLLGKLKPGDIPADVRDNAIRTMADKYFPPHTVDVTGYGFDMLSVSYTHLTLPTTIGWCRSRWSPYH